MSKLGEKIVTPIKNESNFRIGSLHYKRKSFLPDLSYFDYEKERKPRAKEAVPYIRNMVDIDILKEKPPEWTTSVSLPKVIGDTDEHRTRFLIRHGLLDETVRGAR